MTGLIWAAGESKRDEGRARFVSFANAVRAWRRREVPWFGGAQSADFDELLDGVLVVDDLGHEGGELSDAALALRELVLGRRRQRTVMTSTVDLDELLERYEHALRHRVPRAELRRSLVPHVKVACVGDTDHRRRPYREPTWGEDFGGDVGEDYGWG